VKAEAPCFLPNCVSLISDVWDLLGSVTYWFSDKLLAPAVVAVVFTGLTNFAIDRFKADREVSTKICDEVRGDLRELQRLSTEYWSRARAADDKSVEAKILSMQADVLSNSEVLRTMGIEIFPSVTASIDFLDVLTGGKFGQSRRAADLDRMRKIVELISQVRAAAVTARLRRLKKTGR
jgi:hypothetical protein